MMKNNLFKCLYWSPYIPVIGFIIVILYSMTGLQNYLCFESGNIDYSEKTKLKIANIYFNSTLAIQMISMLTLINLI